MRSLSQRIIALAAVGLTSLTLTACGNSSDGSEATNTPEPQETATVSPDQGEWPRTITHEMGETVLEAKPERIVSTSLSVTGTLLAIDAPVVATAATSPSPITDDKGFFSQWADVADERGVEVLYDNLEFDMEALIASDPDLVIISTSGADSVADQYEQISAEFPTIVVDYSKQTWQDLATELGDATGHEDGAAKAIEDFDGYAANAAEKITAPEGGVSIVSFNGPGADQGIGKTTGPHFGTGPSGLRLRHLRESQPGRGRRVCLPSDRYRRDRRRIHLRPGPRQPARCREEAGLPSGHYLLPH